MDISAFWTVIGLMVWPELVLCVILWGLGHPWLGVFALLVSWRNGKTLIRERIIDFRTGRTVQVTEQRS